MQYVYLQYLYSPNKTCCLSIHLIPTIRYHKVLQHNPIRVYLEVSPIVLSGA